MPAWVRRWIHRLKGRTTLFQFYATVHARTCEDCLSHHGEITAHPDVIRPPLHPDCRCLLLEFPVDELETYREKGVRMREKAGREIERRRLFREANECLARPEGAFEALDRFARAAQMDLFLEEVEMLCQAQHEVLSQSSRLSRELRDLFLRAYRYKYDREKYRHMPEGMRAQRRDHGLAVIRSLFEAYASGAGEA